MNSLREGMRSLQRGAPALIPETDLAVGVAGARQPWLRARVRSARPIPPNRRGRGGKKGIWKAQAGGARVRGRARTSDGAPPRRTVRRRGGRLGGRPGAAPLPLVLARRGGPSAEPQHQKTTRKPVTQAAGRAATAVVGAAAASLPPPAPPTPTRRLPPYTPLHLRNATPSPPPTPPRRPPQPRDHPGGRRPHTTARGGGARAVGIAAAAGGARPWRPGDMARPQNPSTHAGEGGGGRSGGGRHHPPSTRCTHPPTHSASQKKTKKKRRPQAAARVWSATRGERNGRTCGRGGRGADKGVAPPSTVGLGGLPQAGRQAGGARREPEQA